MIGIKNNGVYIILLEKLQEKFAFRTVFLEKECKDYANEEDLMVVLNGLSITCYGKDIKKAKELLIEKCEEDLKNQINMICELKLKEGFSS